MKNILTYEKTVAQEFMEGMLMGFIVFVPLAALVIGLAITGIWL